MIFLPKNTIRINFLSLVLFISCLILRFVIILGRVGSAIESSETDTVRLPHARLHNGIEVPLVGLGCASGVRKDAVSSALSVGYRSFDTAQSYRWGYHEDDVGDALYDYLSTSSELKRSDLTVQTKIHPEDLGYDATLRAISLSLKRLKVDYLNSVLLHKPRCWEGACTKKPEGTWQESWRALEELYDRGIVLAIGICDVDDEILDELLLKRIKPHIIQNWMDPLHQDKNIRDRCQKEGSLYQGYSSLGTQWEHFHGIGYNPVLVHPVLQLIANNHGQNIGVAQVVINWATRRGMAVVPASRNPQRQRANLIDSFKFDLTNDEVSRIDALDGTNPRVRTNTNQQKQEKGSAANDLKISVNFQNSQSENPVWLFYYSTGNGGEIPIGKIEPLDTASLDSYHGHRFLFKDQDNTVIYKYTIDAKQGQHQHIRVAREEEL